MRNRELPRVVLPTFALLARAAATSRRKRSLSDVLLLVLRMAIIVLGALGLAAPYLNSRVSFGDGQAATVTVVIDDSLSMARSDAGSTLIERARQRALDVLTTLAEGSEISVVLGGKPARVLVPLSRDLASARRALEAAPLRAVRAGDLAAALELGSRQQSRGHAGPRRMLLLSDFARHNAVLSAPDGVELSTERIGDAAGKPNLFITEAHAAPDPTRPQEISIAVELRALPALQPPATRVEVDVGGKRVTGAAVEFERGVAKSVLHVPAAAGLAEARVRLIADDALDADNQVSVLLGHTTGVSVLLVNGDPHPASRSDELYYVTRALALVPDALLALHTQSVDPLSFEHVPLTDIDVVVLANAPPPSEALAGRLLQFVRQGGGIIVAAGSRVDPLRYNALLGGLLASHIRGLGQANGVHFAPGSVPNFLPEGLLGLREAQTNQRLLLEGGPAETLLAFEDGPAALTARSEGDGRSLLLATSLDADNGDLPFRPGFMPLLAAMIRDAAGVAAATHSHVSPGESVLLPVLHGAGFIEVRAPDGRTQRFSQATQPQRFTATDSLGVFEIRTGRSASTAPSRDAFVVDPPREESDLTPGPVPSDPARSASQRAAINVHKPFTAPLLLLLFALVIAEGLLRARGRLLQT
jgi:hypothetical protein